MIINHMHMKKYLPLGIAAALGLTLFACQSKEQDVLDESFCAPPEDVEFYAEMEQAGEDADTKVFADKDLKVLWDADDCISIFNKYTYNRKYRFQGETGATAGVFKPEPLSESISGSSLKLIYAVYPYQEETYVLYDAALSVNFPTQQAYAEKSFGRGANVMVSTTFDNYLFFKNAGGYLAVKLYGEGVKVSGLRIEGNGGERLSGPATIYVHPDKDPEVAMTDEAVSEVFLSCSEPVELGATPDEATTFWVVIPPTYFGQGFTLTVYDERGKAFVKQTDREIWIERNYISTMSPVEVVMPAQPDNEIWYTTTDGNIIQYPYQDPTEGFWPHVVSNVYENGQGVITCDEPITVIGPNAFQMIQNLASIELPGSVKTIGYAAFNYCPALTEIWLPEGVESIQASAFQLNENLQKVYVPSTVTEFIGNPFISCPNLSFVGPLASEDSHCLVSNGVLIAFSPNGLSEYVIPDGVREIGESAFEWSGLSKVEVPEGVQVIQYHAFNLNYQLTEVILSEGLQEIGRHAFTACTVLPELFIPSSVESIGIGAFLNCRQLERFSGKFVSEDSRCLIVDGNLVAVALKDLEDYTVPDGVSRLSSSTFGAIRTLRHLTFPASLSQIGSLSISNTYNVLETITLLSVTPPVPDYEGEPLFNDLGNCVILVPSESYDAYVAAPGWSNYAESIRVAGNYYGVYFPEQDASGDHLVTTDEEPAIEITLVRSNTEGEIVVPVSTKFSEEGIFTLGEIRFADGEAETTCTLSFANAALGVNYSAHIEITDPAYAAPSLTSIDLSVTRVQMQYFLNPETGEKALVHWTQGWWGETVDTYIKYYELNGVRICTTETLPETHYTNGSYYTGYGFWGLSAVEGQWEWTFYWFPNQNNADGHNLIRIPNQLAGWHNDKYDADVYVRDYFDYNVGGGSDEEFLSFAANNSGVVSYYDGNGGFYLSVRSYYMYNVGGWGPGLFETVGEAEGFDRGDYSLSLSTDYPSDGVTPVFVNAGADIDYVDYKVLAGELSPNEIDEQIALALNGGTGLTRIEDFNIDDDGKHTTLRLSPARSGKYTVIALAYSSTRGYKNSASIVFNHITAEDAQGLIVNVSVYAEDVPDGNCHDSFVYGISGKDLTEVHVAVFPARAIDGDGLENVMNVVKNEPGYAVNGETLAAINFTGYSTVYNKALAETTYYVIVWATNGSLDTVVYDTYTTAPLPYEWTYMGQGTLTDDFLNPMFGYSIVTVPCDFYQDPNFPGIYMMTGFQLELSAHFWSVDVSEMEQYEGEDNYWYNARIIIDARNPEAVVINDQAFGIYINTNYGSVRIQTEATGTLTDGRIVWPSYNVYLGLTAVDTWYSSNRSGGFEITFPEAASSAGVSRRAAASGSMKVKKTLKLIDEAK